MKSKQVKNSLKDWLLYRLEECNPNSIAIVIAGFLTIMMLSLIVIIMFAACKQIKSFNSSDDAVSSPQDTTQHTTHYQRPEIPQMMTDTGQRAVYYVKHYWDGYSTADTAFIHSDETEQLYADFIDALQYVDTAEVQSAITAMLTHMEADSVAYAHFCMLSEKYLYDPNSPMRNENFYIPVLRQMLASSRLTEPEKIRPADRLKQAYKNRPGMKATDFSYVTPKGKTARLSQLQSEYILLFFYDPDCTSCREFENVLSEMPLILDLQEKGILRVLAIYPDTDENEWLLKSSQMPEGWIVGWNKQGDIRSKTLYEIRATPTLYLLDKQKNVILKDAPLERIIRHLARKQQEQVSPLLYN